MHARITTLQGSPEKLDEAVAYVNDTVIPGAKGLPGFTGGYWLADRGTGRMIAITMFESESALRESEDAADQLRTAGAQTLDSEIVSVERFEIVAQA